MSGEIEGPTVEWVSIETYTRALQQLAAAEGRAVEWKAGYHEQVRKLARSVADCEIAKIERDAQIARQAEQLAALTKIGNEAAQLHEMTAQYIAVLEPTWLPEDHESRVSARAQVAGHRSRVEQIQAVLAAAEQPAAPSADPCTCGHSKDEHTDLIFGCQFANDDGWFCACRNYERHPQQPANAEER